MSLKKDEILQLLDELQPLYGAQVQKLTQPSFDEFLLQLRIPGETLFLLLSLAPGQERFHLLPSRPSSLPSPSPFCMRLRKTLLHRRLRQFALPYEDRIVSFRFQQADLSFTLIAELIPRRANLLLCDHDLRLLSSFRPLPPQRGLRVGDLYTPFSPQSSPPSQAAAPSSSPPLPKEGPGVDLQTSDDSSPPRVDLQTSDDSSASGVDLQTSDGDSQEDDASQEDSDSQEDGPSDDASQEDEAGLSKPKVWASSQKNQEIAARYEERTETSRVEQIKTAALKRRRADLKKGSRLQQNLAKDEQKCLKSLEAEKDAELLKPVLHQIKRGMDSFVVTDYFDPALSQKTIALDPTLLPQQQVEKLFQQVKRARKGLASIGPRLRELADQIALLELQIEAISAINDIDELLDYLPKDETQASPKKAKPTAAVPYHEFLSQDGHKIWVGKNSQANDELTFHLARGNDLWLHARGVPGSHVLVPLKRGEIPPHEVLLDAATLAIYYSKIRNDTHPEVIHTYARYVSKPKHAPPGLVSVLRDQNLSLRLDTDRLNRLLKRSLPPHSF